MRLIKVNKSIVGKLVMIQGDHPWSGHTGEVVETTTRGNKRRVKVRLHDTQGHECFVFNESEFKILT